MSAELLKFQKFFLVNTPNQITEHPIDNDVAAVNIEQVDRFNTFVQANPDRYQVSEPKTPGYFVFSTAPFNTEDGSAELKRDWTPALDDFQKAEPQLTPDPAMHQPELSPFKQAIHAIANDLYQRQISPNLTDSPELVITIHGYNTEENNIRRWYKSIYRYLNQDDPYLSNKNHLVFLGYRWSSENMSLTLPSIAKALNALPILPKILVIAGVALALVCLVLLFTVLNQSVGTLILGSLIGLFAGAAGLVFSLVVLRLIVYFRDNYRASNFGVLDLVELIRQLNKAIVDRAKADGRDPESLRRINLSFIGHSMGGFVVSNVIRILSDVFDSRSVEKTPSSAIGDVFCLNRLVLASPDIPVLAIAATRANFLASSLRRFNEAYLFSNEGDLALRIASTAANYFSFPARTRESGYRLGNVSIKSKGFGIVNLSNLKRYCHLDAKLAFQKMRKEDTAMNFLFVTNLSGKTPHKRKAAPSQPAPQSVDELTPLGDISKERLDTEINQFTIADLFTYFDCTDYIEAIDVEDTGADYKTFAQFLDESKPYKQFVKDQLIEVSPGLIKKYRSVGLLTRARNKLTLSLWDYVLLMKDYVSGRDVHGGYFVGAFSKQLIYRLAFLGFDELLMSIDPSPTFDPERALDTLGQHCRAKGIQVLLSPLRYSVSVQRQNVKEVKENILEQIKS